MLRLHSRDYNIASCCTIVQCAVWLVVFSVLLISCGTPDATKESASSAARTSRDLLYREGHQLYMTGNLDSARTVLHEVLQIDSAHVDALTDLGMLHYDLAMAQKSGEIKAKNSNLREALGYLARAERVGAPDDAVYERLCQISLALDDDRSFLTYARKSAERFPFERQYYNLGLAYFGVGDYQNVVKSQKEAIQKFPQSQYLGGYYRQLGRAYMKIDRDQTAQRNLESGLSAVDVRFKAEVKEHGSASDAARRLGDDRTAILQLLRHLYLTYHFDDKLKNVDRLLNESDSRR